MVFRPAAETLQHVMKQPQPRPRRVGIVQPRYLARRRAADHVGIVRLPAPLIALAHERRRCLDSAYYRSTIAIEGDISSRKAYDSKWTTQTVASKMPRLPGLRRWRHFAWGAA